MGGLLTKGVRHLVEVQNQKNLRAIHGRYFETCSFRWYLRFGLKVLEFKVNSKILLFAEIKAGFLKLSKNT